MTGPQSGRLIAVILRSGCLITPYTTPLSDYRVHKTVTIGFAGIPNVIEFLTEVFIPEPVLKGNNNFTAVLNYEFFVGSLMGCGFEGLPKHARLWRRGRPN